MKKALALLAVLAAMTCTLASCGNDKDDDKDTKKSGTSVSDSADEKDEESGESSEEETSADDESSDESSEEETTEEAPTEEDTTEKKSDTAVIDDDTVNDPSQLIGAWLSDDGYGFRFEEGGTLAVVVDATSSLYFADGTLYLQGNDIGKENVSFDGQTLSVTVSGADMLTMKKEEKSSEDALDGVYDILSGAFYDGMASSFLEKSGSDDFSAYGVINGKSFYVEFPGMVSYTADESKITLKGTVVETLGLEDGADIKYAINGDSLILIDTNGTDINFTKTDYR